MKKYYNVIFYFFIGVLLFYSLKVEAIMPLTGKTIIIDPGHGAEDVGANYLKVYEKDITLKISLYLEEILASKGATIILTRDADYDLSKPNANYRKKSDFDNRIKLINESNADVYLSIHLNYLGNPKYYGPQVFYNKNNKLLAEKIQLTMNKYTNSNREIKKIPSDTYMYSKLNIPGVLIECGFLSNSIERNLLQKGEYQKKIAQAISEGLLEYF